MTPDRTEHTPDEPENGVLSETGSIDTTGLGILGGATAQVNVQLPSESEDDLADDGVIDDEVPFVIEIPADADLPVIAPAPADEYPLETAQAEIVETPAELEEWTVEGEGFAPAAPVEDIADADEVFEALPVEEPRDRDGDAEVMVEDAADLHEQPEAEAEVAPEAPAPAAVSPAVQVEMQDEVGTEPPAAADSAEDEFDIVDFDVAEFEDADFDEEFDPAEFDRVLAEGIDDVEGEAALAENAPTGDDVIATDDTAEEPMIAKTPADDGKDAGKDAGKTDAAAAASAPKTSPAPKSPAPPSVSASAAAAKTATGSTPATRRQANHTGAQPVMERSAVERAAFARSDVALASKRLGEFEADRETADLLTADRLLDPHQVVRPEPEGAWQHFVYSISGRRINLGDSKRARARKELDRRIAAPLVGGARFVPVLSRKGGVGKTTVTTLLGMALAGARDDRVIAVDANPDRGTLAERISGDSGKTVRDLVRISPEVVGFNDLSNIVARDETRLDVVASDSDPRVSEAFNDADYRDVAALAAHYYSVVLTDTGTGIVHSVMGATLDLADQLVIVAGLSVDEARLASETLTWLETNGYSDKVRNAVVVLNNARPGHPLVQLDELESHFRTRVRAVVRVPYDAHIAAGSAIVFRELQPATRDAARELAATVVEGLRSLASAA
ncbi:AAA family ATPase [Microbacterium sp. ProA8]|uniref:MinD/ParA family ATP-binding protein n=1 Tax=Microbacterium chionoecetis TaxID=3153754 RepID=UPI003263DCD3